jgi:hypothetical protein
MKVSLAIVTISTLLLSPVPASAKTIYPTRPCRVYVDTDYTQIAEQCGTVGRFYHRRLFVRAARQSSYYYGTLLLTGDHSRGLKVGDRVCWGATSPFLGTTGTPVQFNTTT